MASLAFLFPGQGSQAPGMGKALAETFPEARSVFEEADSRLGFNLSRLCFGGSADDLKPTEVAQPALLTCSVAALRCVEAKGMAPSVCLGHSLGEYSALVAAGVLEFGDAVLLVRRRGELMAEAARQHPGTMAAVLGLDAEQVVEEICQSIRNLGPLTPANFNGGGQIVISGTVEAVRAASEKAKEAGALRVAPLSVSGAFHSPLMRDATVGMAAELERVPFKEAPSSRYLEYNRSSFDRSGSAQAGAPLAGGVGRAVEESMKAAAALGADRFLEVGAGKVLSGLAKRIVPGCVCLGVGEPAGVEALGELTDRGEDAS